MYFFWLLISLRCHYSHRGIRAPFSIQGLDKPLLVNITPLNADQFPRAYFAIYIFISNRLLPFFTAFFLGCNFRFSCCSSFLVVFNVLLWLILRCSLNCICCYELYLFRIYHWIVLDVIWAVTHFACNTSLRDCNKLDYWLLPPQTVEVFAYTLTI